MLPTDPRIKSLSPYQVLWLFGHIVKEKREERAFLTDMVKLLCAMINPEGAKKVFSREDETIIGDSDFEANIKSLDPHFNFNAVKDLLGEENG